MDITQVEGLVAVINSIGRYFNVAPAVDKDDTYVGTGIQFLIYNQSATHIRWYFQGSSGLATAIQNTTKVIAPAQDATLYRRCLIVYKPFTNEIILRYTELSNIPDDIFPNSDEIELSKILITPVGQTIVTPPVSSIQAATQTEVELAVTTTDITVLDAVKYISVKGLKWFKDKLLSVAYTFSAITTFSLGIKISNLTSKKVIATDSNGNIIASTLTNGKIWKGDSSNVPQEVDAPISFSGSYTDLTNKPTIPSDQVNSDWNSSTGLSKIMNKPTIPTLDYKVKCSSNDSTADYIETKLSLVDNQYNNTSKLIEIDTINDGSNEVRRLKFDISKVTAASVSSQADYLWANSTEKGAQGGMVAGSIGIQVDTTEIFQYNGSAWVSIGFLSNPSWILINSTYYTATPNTTSTITIVNTGLYAQLSIGDGIKFKTGGVYYYARISEKTTSPNRITIEGIALTTGSASITELYYGKEKNVGRRISVNINNSDWLATTTNNIFTEGYTAYPIHTPDAYLVAIKTWSKTVDSGSNKAAIKILGGDVTNNISSLTDGVIFSTAKTYNSSLVTINSTYYKFAGDTIVKAIISQCGSNKDTTEAIVELFFIFM